MGVDTFPYPFCIGIIGGGQLGKMTAQAAKAMGFEVAVLSTASHAPAVSLADNVVIGDLYDSEKLQQLAEFSDVLTYEVEHIDTKTLRSLYQLGQAIFPAPQVLETIQDKLKQKQALVDNGVPTARFEQVDVIDEAYLSRATYPFVQKARLGGYDGKGVAVIKSPHDREKVLDAPSLVEEFVKFDKELAVIVARNKQGQIACYPVVEMIFDPRTNICDIVAAPANISANCATRARDVAVRAVKALHGVGLFGVEMFLTTEGDVLVNEIAPRPHNSGHYTIEACTTSQFEQLVRIVANLPLGDTQLLKPAAMWNILGDAASRGKPSLEGVKEALRIPNLAFHLYGKATTRPFRKMGHVTVLDETVDAALAKIHQVEQCLRIKGDEKI